MQGPEYSSPAGSASCTICADEFYWVQGKTKVNDYTLNGECREKPAGVKVMEGAEGTTLESMKVLGGYYRFSSTSTEVYECHHRENW